MIRAARPDEAALLSELALRSKAAWGYDPVFLQACREELTVSAAKIEHAAAFVYEHDRELLAFYCLDVSGTSAELSFLFVDPLVIGQGIGRRLWRHLVGEARRRDVGRIVVESDPNAADFYRAMGAVDIGVVASHVVLDRELPVLAYVVPSALE